MPVTPLIARFRAGSESAFTELFDLFFCRQVRQAERVLPGGRRGLADGEDLALSAFGSLWQEVAAGRFSGNLENTTELLAILRLLTTQKVRRSARYDRQDKRDVRRTVDVTDEIAARPHRAIATSGSIFPPMTPRQSDVIRLTSEGWLRAEIATMLRCSVRTVDRELVAVRAAVEKHAAA